ncbi:MAG: zinc metallopeptidase [Oscillospiraceae bacterium]|nr:zinc metallopeptidase [Oscillospiraceae bacterium]
MDYTVATILLFAAIIISLFASINVNSTFKKYSSVMSRRGYRGADLARYILDANGLNHVRIESVAGDLTDHYDPTAECVRLSQSTYNSTSIAALGVVAHECGHAVQHAESYAPIKIRNAVLPVANIGSNVSWILLVLGIALSFGELCMIGVILFSAVVAFQLITLPVEFNASARAMNTLENFNILDEDELKISGKVLTAAAMTYVAALLVSLANLLRMIALANRRR